MDRGIITISEKGVVEGRIGNTLVLGGIGFLLIFTLALLLGIFCAWKEDT